MQESKTTFFRQSGWLAIANTLCGVFLVGVYPLLSFLRVPDVDLGIFATMLRLFTVLAIPAAGLQIVMAQEAAAAVTEEQKRQLRVTVKCVLLGIFAVWVIIAVICGIYRIAIRDALQLSDLRTLWVTVMLVLCALCLPLTQGLLQGLQNFLWLGWSVICIGAGRFAAILLCVLLLGGHATAALLGALVGVAAAVLIALWPDRGLFRGGAGKFDWAAWLKRALPLAGGTGSVLFLMQADVLFVQGWFPKEIAPFYTAGSIIGVGLVTFTTPMAAVMFPKLVRSFAQGQRSDSLPLALGGTLVLGLLGATVCTIWPELPLKILFFGKPQFLRSSELVPWFMWSMLPLTLGNVLVSSLMAQSRFAAVPWLMLVAVGYGITLHRFLGGAETMEAFLAFKRVVQTLGGFSLSLFAVAALFTVLARRSKTGP